MLDRASWRFWGVLAVICLAQVAGFFFSDIESLSESFKRDSGEVFSIGIWSGISTSAD